MIIKFLNIFFIFIQKYNKTTFEILFVFLCTTETCSQNINNKRLAKSPLFTKEVYSFKLQNETYHFCDTDSDGFMPINLLEIKKIILQKNENQFDSEGGIFISTSEGNVYFISNISGTPQKTLICTNRFGPGMLDIAVNQDGDIYVSVANKIYKINPTTCQIKITYDFGFSFNSWVTSLSFDRNNNLYFGGVDSNVYRLENGAYNQLLTWHNFGAGVAAGDFVMYNDKMYIAWDLNNSTRLYEVTVDSNTNYVSHIDLGVLPNNTFGLASELGFLYGLTSGQLYKINLNPLSFTTVFSNLTSDDWYGAAGKNEAVEITSAVFETESEALNYQNPLPDLWINTVSGGQTVYVAITNTANNQQIIIPVDLVIDIPPFFTNPSAVINCGNNTTDSTYDLLALEPIIKGSQADVAVLFFESQQDAVTNTRPLADVITTNGKEKQIFVRMTNLITTCNAIYSFTIRTVYTPVFEELDDFFYCITLNYPIHIPVDLEQKRSVIFGNQKTPDIKASFYFTSQDANRDTNSIINPFYLEENQKQIFVRLEDNSSGCFEIKSFIINTVTETPSDLFTYTVETKDWTYDDNSIQIFVTGSGDFEYSIDGINYQNTPLFDHLSTGDYEVHVRDKSDCSAVIKEVLLLMYPNFFTPNGDGFNDFWNIKFSTQEPNMKIYIFDRYGKLLRVLSPLESGWDGNYHRRPMPSTDYWFLVIREDKKEYKGHFSLKR